MIKKWNKLKSCELLQGCVATFGVFDGFHQGHQYITEQAVQQAKIEQRKSVAITFDIDPDEKFKKGFLKLQSNEDRIKSVSDAGIDYVLVLQFNDTLKNCDPQEFLDKLFGKFTPKCLHVGENFYFGKNAKGNVELLKNWGKIHCMDVVVHQLIKKDGIVVSSTNIRKSLIKNALNGKA